MKQILIGIVFGVSASALGLVVTSEDSSWVKSAHAATSDSFAMQLSRLVLSKDSYSAMIRQVMQGMIQASGQPADAKTQAKLEAVMLEAMPYDEMLQLNATVYGARFNDGELRNIIVFYKTPAGAKLVKELPNISADVGQIMGKIIPERLPALMKKHGLTK
jgi:hypothetical protein